MKDDIKGNRGYALIASKLRIGDVILTCGTGLESFAIAAGTFGPFSHAAVWLPRVPCIPNVDPFWNLELFESDDLGVGETLTTNAYITLHDGTRLFAALVSGAARVAVFRHPAMGSISIEQQRKATIRLKEREQYLGYSQLARLAAAASQHPILQNPLARVLMRVDNRDVTLVPGAFCSELVAKFYQEIGLPLFDPPKSPEKTSPNALSKSMLREQPGIAIALSAAKNVDVLRVHELPRSVFLPVMVKYRSQSIRISESVVEIDKRIASMAKDTFQIQFNTLVDSLKCAIEKAEFAESYGDFQMAEKLLVTAQSFNLALSLCAEIVQQQSMLSNSSVWFSAEARLRRTVGQILNSGQIAFTRQSALADARIGRALYRLNSTPENAARLRAIRENSLSNAWAVREMNRQLVIVLEQTDMTSAGSVAEDRMVDDIVTKAIERSCAEVELLNSTKKTPCV